MSTKVQIIKRLEILKNSIELEDSELIDMQVKKLEEENDKNLTTILELVKNEDYSKISKAIDEYVYGFKNAALTLHQQVIFDAVVKDIDEILDSYSYGSISPNFNFISLSGSAGVGKTFVASKLIEKFIEKKYKMLLTTPTHKSLNVAKYMLNSNNIQIPTKTLQSYLDLKLDTDDWKGTKVFKRDKLDAEHDYERDLDILIVDESSMVSNDLLGFIEENLTQSKLKSVLFIGDPYQLPPVDSGVNGVENLPKQHLLTQIVRQAQDSYIKVIANELKESIKNKKYQPLSEIFSAERYPNLKIFYEEKDFLEDFSSKDKWYECNNIVVSYTNSNVDKFNRIIRYKFWQDKGIEANDAVINGDLLVFNDSYGRKFQNSELITVVNTTKEWDEIINISYWDCIDSTGRGFKVIDPSYTVQYNEYVTQLANKARSIKNDDLLRRKSWRHYFATKETYADMKYIFASTIHKSQGSTHNVVYIDMPSILSLVYREEFDIAYRLLYVAITRASKDIKILK